MSQQPLKTRSLKDYRPQHDEDCASRYCAAKHLSQHSCQLSRGAWEHTEDRETWGGSYHKFVAGPCSCGLQALLDEAERPPLEHAQQMTEAMDNLERGIAEYAHHDPSQPQGLIDVMARVLPIIELVRAERPPAEAIPSAPLKRYNIHGIGAILEAPDGEWVRFADQSAPPASSDSRR